MRPIPVFAGTLNVVYLEGAYEDDTHVHLVMEHCKGGELWHRIGDQHYSERTVASYMRAVLRTLAQCHSHNLLHLDIKPGNFLLLDSTETSPVKAIDFGLCQPFKDDELPMDVGGFDGTPWYQAPEQLRSEVVPASDVWAAGVMCHQLLTGRFPFDDKKSPYSPSLALVWRSILLDEVDFNRSYWDGISEEARDFVRMLLNKDPTQRPTAKQALKHPWLQGDARSRGEGKPLSKSVVQRIQRYAQGGVLKRTVLEAMAEELLASQKAGNSNGAMDIPRADQENEAGREATACAAPPPPHPRLS